MTTYGGGIYNRLSSNPILTNVTISGNTASMYGGGIYNRSSSNPILTNVTISGNTASMYGGGIYNNNNSSPTLTNVTISGNTADNGGGIYNMSSSNPKIRNSIIYGNNSGIFNNGSASVITYSLVQGLGEDVPNHNFHGSNDPKFVSPQTAGLSTAGDYRLQDGSPVINKGNNTYFDAGQTPDLSAIITDLDGNPRKLGVSIDLGAYENQYPTIRYVVPNGAGTKSGLSWGDASGDLQAMINTSTATFQVWVAGGTYKPQYRADNMSGANANDRNNAFVLKKDVKVYGGFAGTEIVLTDRDLTKTANASILSGDLGTPDNNLDNAYHVVISAGLGVGTAELNGFTIKDGHNTNTTTDITVNEKYINSHGGGGIYNSYSSPILTNVTISGNRAFIYGGGIYNTSSSPILTNVIISGNTTTTYGGGIYNEYSSPILTNVTISGNNVSRGGGIYNSSTSNPKIRNSIIYGNSSGIYNMDGNSIPVISYSLVQGSTDVTNGNIDGSTNPLFESPQAPGLSTAGDYRLQDGSPVINKGNNTYFDADQTPDLHLITTDLDGNPRIYGANIDLGAYENQTNNVSVTLFNFTAKAENTNAKLEWQTASESNNKEFLIAHSVDGKSFTEIGRVGGAGNSSTEKEYVFYDKNPVQGINYYRLQQVDFDGRITDHGVRKVEFSVVTGFVKMYPNPIKDVLQIEFTAGKYQQIEIADNSGRVLQRITLNAMDTQKTINLSTQSAGVYFVRMVGTNIVVQKIVKN